MWPHDTTSVSLLCQVIGEELGVSVTSWFCISHLLLPPSSARKLPAVFNYAITLGHRERVCFR